MLARLLRPRLEASAHCDLPCGVYDPAQARIEAESVKAIIEKYHDSDDPVFQDRALTIKEERAELVKHHLWVLWTDYFKPPHLEKYPQLHQLFNEATKLAGEAAPSHVDVAVADELLAKIDEIAKIFWETKKAAYDADDPQFCAAVVKDDSGPQHLSRSRPVGAEDTRCRGTVGCSQRLCTRRTWLTRR